MIVLPRCMQCRRGLAMRILSVCLSVKRVDCDKTGEKSVQIFMPYKRSFSLVFREEEWSVGANPSTWKFGSTILLFRKLGYVMCGLDTTFFRFVTNYAFDRQTDGDTARILIARPRLHFMQRGKNETRYAVLPATLRWRLSIVISWP